MEENMIPILVIHVKGQKAREESIERQLRPLGIPFSYILDGDCADLTQEIIDAYFKDNGKAKTMYGTHPRTSCAYKHILACKHIIDNDLEAAFVLEDDIMLHSDFGKKMGDVIDEYRREHADEPFMANFEDSSLKFIPRSQRVKGRMLYRAKRDRFTGCLMINNKAARAIVEHIEKHQTDLPIDHYHSFLAESGVINYYWCQPCLATQGSFTGAHATTISDKNDSMIRLRWFFKYNYKKLLYWLR